MEILVEVPGKWWFEPDAISTDGKTIDLKKIKVDDEAKYYGNLVLNAMVEAEEYYLNKIMPNCPIPGLANAAYSPFWAH